MEVKNMPDVQDAPEVPTEETPDSAPQETTANFFASLLSALRYACEHNGLDFAALSQSDVPGEPLPLVKQFSRAVADALHVERREGIGLESSEKLLSARIDVESLAYVLATDPRFASGTHRYIGKAKHLYKANKRRVLDVFQQACENKASGLTFTIEFPTFQTGNPLKDAWYHAHLKTHLPRAAGFAVVDADGGCLYTLRTVKTWEEALQAEQEIPLSYNLTREVFAVDEDGRYFDSVGLSTSCRSDETTAPEIPEMA